MLSVVYTCDLGGVLVSLAGTGARGGAAREWPTVSSLRAAAHTVTSVDLRSMQQTTRRVLLPPLSRSFVWGTSFPWFLAVRSFLFVLVRACPLRRLPLVRHGLLGS